MTTRATIAVALLLTACASQTEMGARAYAAGKYDKAFERWVPAAAAGDAANYNMGLLWQQGLTSMTPKNADRAGEFFIRAANLGFSLAMGPAAEYSLSQGNTDAALTWLNLGARWNDPASIQRLQSLGAPVPAADLALAQQQALLAQPRIEAANALIIGQMVGCAVSGGCADDHERRPLLRSSPIRRLVPK